MDVTSMEKGSLLKMPFKTYCKCTGKSIRIHSIGYIFVVSHVACLFVCCTHMLCMHVKLVVYKSVVFWNCATRKCGYSSLHSAPLYPFLFFILCASISFMYYKCKMLFKSIDRRGKWASDWGTHHNDPQSKLCIYKQIFVWPFWMWKKNQHSRTLRRAHVLSCMWLCVWLCLRQCLSVSMLFSRSCSKFQCYFLSRFNLNWVTRMIAINYK